jgi:hypothetical protein
MRGAEIVGAAPATTAFSSTAASATFGLVVYKDCSVTIASTVAVTFSSAGVPKRVEVNGGQPLPVASCVAERFCHARVPPFPSGSAAATWPIVPPPP